MIGFLLQYIGKKEKEKYTMKKYRPHIYFVALLCLLCTILPLATACNRHEPPAYADLDFSDVDPATCEETDAVTNYVKISVSIVSNETGTKTEYEDIIIRLFPEVAPITVANFQKLVSEHFYDGLTFHRIMKDFMIQGGDPKGDGTGDTGTDIKGEFNLNGFRNNLKHIRGVISMARGTEFDSGSCQFFIVHKTSSHLNGAYASFGYVVAGMDTVDAIVETPVKNNAAGENSKPIDKVIIESIRFVEPQ
jgi:cyclophilin family peptidyl-prolyl cis-trans isomerase